MRYGISDAAAMLAAAERAAGRPLRAMIEIADRCNEVCLHCYQEQGKKGEMSTEQLEALIDDLAEQGVLVLTISGGEATLRKDFLRIMGHARKRGFMLRLFTNGLTMTAELAAALHALAIDVVEISLYSERAEVHDFVTGVPGSFERTVAGIRHLVACSVDVLVKTPIMAVNEQTLDAYMDFVEGLGAAYSFDTEALSPRESATSPRESATSPRESASSPRECASSPRECASSPRECATREPSALDRSDARAGALLANPRLGASKTIVKLPPARRTLCGAGDTIHVEPNGDVRPCVVLPMNMGNAVVDGGVGSALDSTLRRQLTSLTWQDAHGCRECDLQAYCQRCHAQGLAEVGDALGPYPSACERARQRYEFVHGHALALHAPHTITDPAGAEAGAHVSAACGPFELLDAAHARAVPDRVEASDDALATELGWVRAQPLAAISAPALEGGTLVQLRRPGRTRPRAERVPDLKPVAARPEHWNTADWDAAE